MRSDHITQRPALYPPDFARRLEHWIDSGVWPSGTPLPTKDELIRIFGASEIDDVHEIIEGLRLRGILTIRPEDGRLVIALQGSGPGYTAGDLGNEQGRSALIVEARRALLSQGARLAASRATPEDMSKLIEALHEDTDSRGPVSLSGPGAFEREVILASGNDFMLRVYERLFILENLSLGHDDDGRSQDDPAFARRELLTAIAARQADAAARLADQLL
ncbi:FadR/GntR family transcriptional regulator [Arthrobacter sp. NPDC090010]|uniref:FadR/GntR family transcriptional regulator n=1 Tax=Arthrobacter sp. NPDC090010 TaxID=3363942 RepID=UPI00382BC007